MSAIGRRNALLLGIPLVVLVCTTSLYGPIIGLATTAGIGLGLSMAVMIKDQLDG